MHIIHAGLMEVQLQMMGENFQSLLGAVNLHKSIQAKYSVYIIRESLLSWFAYGGLKIEHTLMCSPPSN